MLSEAEKQQLIELVDKALMDKILPQLFTKDQLAQMNEPYHSIYDHAGPAHIYSLDPATEEFGYLKPQLAISDPRISDAMIEKLPKTIDVEWKGKTCTLPLRIFKWSQAENTSVAEWNKRLEKIYNFRRLAEKLEKSLSDTFNLVADKDYALGMGQTIKGDCLFFQSQNKNTWQKHDEISKHLKKELAQIPEGQVFKDIAVMGPVQAAMGPVQLL